MQYYNVYVVKKYSSKVCKCYIFLEISKVRCNYSTDETRIWYMLILVQFFLQIVYPTSLFLFFKYEIYTYNYNLNLTNFLIKRRSYVNLKKGNKKYRKSFNGYRNHNVVYIWNALFCTPSSHCWELALESFLLTLYDLKRNVTRFYQVRPCWEMRYLVINKINLH